MEPCVYLTPAFLQVFNALKRSDRYYSNEGDNYVNKIPLKWVNKIIAQGLSGLV